VDAIRETNIFIRIVQPIHGELGRHITGTTATNLEQTAAAHHAFLWPDWTSGTFGTRGRGKELNPTIRCVSLATGCFVYHGLNAGSTWKRQFVRRSTTEVSDFKTLEVSTRTYRLVKRLRGKRDCSSAERGGAGCFARSASKEKERRDRDRFRDSAADTERTLLGRRVDMGRAERVSARLRKSARHGAELIR